MRYGIRILRKSPGFTAAAVTTLALAIGANTAIFSVVYAVLLRPLPFPHAERLVLFREVRTGAQMEKTGAPYPHYAAWAERSHALEAAAAYWNVSGDAAVFGGAASAERVQYTIVTSGFFRLLGAQPALGRGFLASEEQPGNGKVFLASDSLWRRSLGAAADALGKTFPIDGERYTLVGILPPSFQFPRDCDIWMPVGALEAKQLADRISHPFWVLGRLRAHIPLSRAQAELDAIQSQLAQAYPGTDANWRIVSIPLAEELIGNVEASLWVLFGAAGFILLIACANIVNLLLARSAAREKEFAIRTALGAGRGHLLRQTLGEGMIIAGLSGCAGLLLADWGLRAIVSVAAIHLPVLSGVRLNAPALVFTALLMIALVIMMGLAPVFQASRSDPQDWLRDGQRGATSGIRGRRTRSLLVIAEVAVTVLLLTGAGLMLRTLLRLRQVDPGFRPNGLLTLKITLPDTEYATRDQRAGFLDRVLEAVKAAPGVRSVAAVNRFPMSGDHDWGSFEIVGEPVSDWRNAHTAEGRSVSANYFRAMGIPLLRGREFQTGSSQSGTRDATDAVIVNQAMAEAFWPGRNPLGQRMVTLAGRPRSREIIGVVGNVKHFGLDAAGEPEMYTPYGWWRSITLVIRCAGDPASVIPAARAQIGALSRQAPVYDVFTADQLADRSTSARRLDLFLLGLFAALALVLAVAGLYGLLAFTIGRRTREIGLRLALGAHPRTVLRMVVTEGMRLVGLGLALGAAASLALTRLMQSLLFEVKAGDPLTLASAAGLLAMAAAAACYIPARRAMKIDPIEALRCE